MLLLIQWIHLQFPKVSIYKYQLKPLDTNFTHQLTSSTSGSNLSEGSICDTNSWILRFVNTRLTPSLSKEGADAGLGAGAGIGTGTFVVLPPGVVTAEAGKGVAVATLEVGVWALVGNVNMLLFFTAAAAAATAAWAATVVGTDTFPLTLGDCVMGEGNPPCGDPLFNCWAAAAAWAAKPSLFNACCCCWAVPNK